MRNLASIFRQNSHLSRPRFETEQNNENLQRTFEAARLCLCLLQIWSTQLWEQHAHWDTTWNAGVKIGRTINNSAEQWLTKIKFARLVQYGSLEAARFRKSTFDQRINIIIVMCHLFLIFPAMFLSHIIWIGLQLGKLWQKLKGWTFYWDA